MILARKIQSPGAWRLAASLWIFLCSSASSGWRAQSSFGKFSSPSQFGLIRIHAYVYLRGSASRLRSAARSAFPSVVSPAAADEPAYGNDNPGEGKPEVDHPPHPLRAPHKLLVGIGPRARPLYHPPIRGPIRRRLAPPRDLL